MSHAFPTTPTCRESCRITRQPLAAKVRNAADTCKSTPKWALIGETNNEEALPSYAGDMCEGRLIRMGLVGVPRE
eukprot:3459836-Pyramimonas_sp.AAC.1